jgi:hypothetical protein
MQLVKYIHEIYLVRHFNLILNNVAEFIIKLFCKVCVTLSVDDVGYATIRHQLSLAFRLILTNVLLSLLVNSLLM